MKLSINSIVRQESKTPDSQENKFLTQTSNKSNIANFSS